MAKTLVECLNDWGGVFYNFIDRELAPYDYDASAYLDVHGANFHTNYFIKTLEGFGIDNNGIFSLWYLCGENNDTACKLIINEYIIQKQWTKTIDNILEFINSICLDDYPKVTEYEINALAFSYMNNGEYGKALDTLNIWREANGMERIESLDDFHPTFDTFVIASGEYTDYDGEETFIEPQNVMCESITSNYNYHIETHKYNCINHVTLNGDTIYEDGVSQRTTDYSFDVTYTDATTPQTHFIFYQTAYNWNWADEDKEKALTPELRQAVKAMDDFWYALDVQIEKMSDAIYKTKNIGDLHDPIACLERAVKRLGDAVREFGGR